jgi:hypothetical protein
MADKYSTQYNSAVVTKKGTQLRANDWGGKVRAYFAQISSTASITTSDTVYMMKLPKGSRILGGRLTYTGATAGSVKVGVSGTLDKYLGATTISTAGGTDVANTPALNHGDLLTADTDILVTPTVDVTTSGTVTIGLVMYVAVE